MKIGKLHSNPVRIELGLCDHAVVEGDHGDGAGRRSARKRLNSLEAAAARHILHSHLELARDVVGKMAPQQPRVCVSPASGGEADNDVHSRQAGLRIGGARKERYAQQSCNGYFHVTLRGSLTCELEPSAIEAPT